MTKERLEEIRKRKYAEDRIVYTVFDNDEEATALHIVYDNELFVAYMMLERVFETKEEAEWHCKMNTIRTQRFEPPMWEDVEDYFFIFVNQAKDGYVLWKFEVIKGKHANSGISIWNDEYELYVADATKENYEKACEIARDLFKGEK